MMVTYFQQKKACGWAAMAILIGLTSGANAGGPDVSTNQVKPVENLFYCPPISALVKSSDTFTWSAPDGWKSFDMSFVDKITHFAGAQWRGTNVGQIFCVYRGELETSFPILLAYNVLAYAPHGGKWSANLGGYQNCETPEQQNCPFSIRLKPEAVDLYQQAEQLKRTAPKSDRPGF
jgi:hypothetical protein